MLAASSLARSAGVGRFDFLQNRLLGERGENGTKPQKSNPPLTKLQTESSALNIRGGAQTGHVIHMNSATIQVAREIITSIFYSMNTSTLIRFPFVYLTEKGARFIFQNDSQKGLMDAQPQGAIVRILLLQLAV